MIEQGGVRLDGEKVSDKGLVLQQGARSRPAGRQAQVRARQADLIGALEALRGGALPVPS